MKTASSWYKNVNIKQTDREKLAMLLFEEYVSIAKFYQCRFPKSCRLIGATLQVGGNSSKHKVVFAMKSVPIIQQLSPDSVWCKEAKDTLQLQQSYKTLL